MKILHVITAFYPCQIWGGPPQNTLTLSRGLQRRGHDVSVLTTNILDYDNRLSEESFQGEWEGVPVTYLKAYWRGRRANSVGFLLAPDIVRFRDLIAAADIVHIHGYRHFLFLSAAMCARQAQTPYVIQARGTMPTAFGRTRLKRIFDRTLGYPILRRAAGAVALNDEEVMIYRAAGMSSAVIKKILNPFDPQVCPILPDGRAFRTRFGIAPAEPIILFLSRLHERKGLDLLIHAFAILESPDARLCIAGPDDGYLRPAQNLVRALGLGHKVIFTGALYDQEKFDAFRAAAVYVLPSKGGEGLPTTVLEACYAGIPTILTNTVELAGLIHNRTGLAVAYDVQSLAAAIRRLLNDAHLAATFRAHTASLLAEHFGLEQALDQFESYYQAILKRKKA